MYKQPNDGGCWFCHTDDGEMWFSWEFDCWVHESCLKKELDTVWNPEAEIMAKEFSIEFVSKLEEPELDDFDNLDPTDKED